MPGAPEAPQPAPATQPAPTTPTDEAVGWTDSICGALVPVVETVRTPPPVDLTNAAATRQAYLDYLSTVQQRAEEALHAMDTAGPPPVPGGEELAREVRDQLTDLRDDLADARIRIESADPNDVPAIGEAIAAAGNVLGSMGNTAQAVAAVSGDPQLRPAFKRAQSCNQLQTIDSPS